MKKLVEEAYEEAYKFLVEAIKNNLIISHIANNKFITNNEIHNLDYDYNIFNVMSNIDFTKNINLDNIDDDYVNKIFDSFNDEAHKIIQNVKKVREDEKKDDEEEYEEDIKMNNKAKNGYFNDEIKNNIDIEIIKKILF